jgi:predicted secreted Zn-dependent protease
MQPPRVFFLRFLLALPLLLAPLPPAAALEKATAVRLQYFDVEGTDHASLLAALKARGHFHGRADWKLSYRLQPRAVADACAAGDISTTLDLAVTLPRWRPPAGVSADLVTRWERYVAALREHEDGHLQHGREFEREFRKAAATLSARDCAALDRAVRAVFNEMLARYQDRDKLYDERTGHGRTQGAVFR